MSDQQSPAPSAAGRPHRITEVSANLFVGVTVIALYIAFVTVVFCGFSGYIARINLAQEVSAKGSLDQLFYLLAREEALQAELMATTKAIDGKTRELGEAQAELSKAEYEIFPLESAMLAVFSRASLVISQFNAYLSPRFVAQYRSELFEDTGFSLERAKRLRLMNLISTPEFIENVDPGAVADVVGLFGDIATEAAAYNASILDALAKFEYMGFGYNVLESERGALEARRATLLDELKTVQSEPVFTYKAVVASFRPILWELFYWLVQIPTIILTMVVTIAAGGLGSVVSFTRNFLFTDTPAGLRRLIVSVGEGVAAAVAIFFLAGAGLLMLTNAGSGGASGAEISPYMVAFIAFVSGFMAEDAFKSIQRAGRSLFQERLPKG